jgi:hypothetical protein
MSLALKGFIRVLRRDARSVPAARAPTSALAHDKVPLRRDPLRAPPSRS